MKKISLINILLLLFISTSTIAQDLSTIESRKVWLQKTLSNMGGWGSSLADLSLNPDNETAQQEIIDLVAKKNEQSIPYGVWALGKYWDHFSSAERNEMKGYIKSWRESNGHGTENHALMKWSASYLFTKWFPGESGWLTNQNTYISSEELHEVVKQKLITVFSSLYDKGYTENLSPTYDWLHIYPILTLLEFDEDEEMIKAAEAALLFHISNLALNNFKGIIASPHNRSHLISNTMRSRVGNGYTNLLNWLYWAENSSYSGDASKWRSYNGNPVLIFGALSNWTPPDPINQIALGNGVPYTTKGFTAGFGATGTGWYAENLRKVYKTGKYAVGSGHMRYKPTEFYTTYKNFSIHYESQDMYNYIECTHNYWCSDDSETNAWNHCTNSPFQEIAQHENTVISLFNIPSTDPWSNIGRWSNQRDGHNNNLIQRMDIRYPKKIDEKVESGGWIFLREGTVYTGIKPLKTYIIDTEASADFDIIRSEGATNAVVFEVGTSTKHSSFANFQNTLKANSLTVDWETLTVDYTNSSNTSLKAKWVAPDYANNTTENDRLLVMPETHINNVIQPAFNINNWQVLESPYVNLNNRNLTIQYEGQFVKVDWTGEHPVITYSDPNETVKTSNKAPIINNQTFEVQGDASQNSFVGKVIASDPNSEQKLVYSITGGNEDNLFAIDSSQGNITVDSNLNFSSDQIILLQVKVTDDGSSPLSSNANVTINISANNDQSNTSDSDAAPDNNDPVINDQTFEIQGNASESSFVGKVIATDPDDGQQLTYSITNGNESDLFSIDPTSGKISVISDLNFSSNQSIVLDVMVSDNGLSPLSSNANVTINISVNNDQSNTGGSNVNELDKLAIVAANAMNYQISNTPDQTIDEDLNTRWASEGINNWIDLELSGTDTVHCIDISWFRGNKRVAYFDIQTSRDKTQWETILDNQKSSGVTKDFERIIFEKPETVKYVRIIGNGNTENSWNSIYEVEMYGKFGIEDNQSENKITEVNQSPIISDQNFEITHTKYTEDFIGQVSASDPNSEQFITYSIISGNEDGLFAINPNTGEITANNTITVATVKSYILSIKVADNNSTPLSAIATITIQVIAKDNSSDSGSSTYQNQVPSIVDQSFEINGIKKVNEKVGMVSASDPDQNQITYSIIGGNDDGLFSINPSTGEIHANKTIYTTIDQTVTLLIKVKDNATNSLSATATVYITLKAIRVNQRPEISSQTFNIREEVKINNIVGQIVANDPDEDQNLTYSIIGGNEEGLFIIDANTGEITTSSTKSITVDQTIVLVIEVIDNDMNSPLTSTANIIINLFSKCVLEKAEVNIDDPQKVILHFSKSLDENLIISETINDFSLSHDKSIHHISFQDSIIYLDIDSEYKYGDTITISYSKGSTSIIDVSGNEIKSFTNCPVDNNLIQTDEINIGEDMGELEVLFYPNPSKGIFNIKADYLKSDVCEVVLFNTMGNLVSRKQLTGAFGSLDKSVNMSHLGRGTYILQFVCENQNYQSKIVIL